jgi:HEAT repeat protein
VRRARAAEAIGEFMDPHGLLHLEAAFEDDDSAAVRRAAVLALGRLNHPGGRTALAAALADDDAGVRRAALSSIRRVNFFTNTAALVTALGDDDAAVRRDAAQLLGQYRVADSAEVLAGLLASDADPRVRQSAAWALGRIGGSVATAALKTAAGAEANKSVKDAIEIARLM